MQLSIFSLSSSDSFLLAAITKDTFIRWHLWTGMCIWDHNYYTFRCTHTIIIPKINKRLSSEILIYCNPATIHHVCMIMVFAFATLLLCVPAVYHLCINDKYWPGIRYYYFLLTGYFFWTITVLVYAFLLYYKKKKQLLFLAIASILISVTSNYFFIKSMSAFGASISVCCSYFIIMILAFVVTKKYWRPLLHPVST